MDTDNKVLSERQGWDSVYSSEYYIKRAVFAIMTTDECAPTVLLCFSENNQSWQYTSVQYYRGDGLHYDGDGSVGKTFMRRRVKNGSSEITASWTECEQFLVPCDLEWRKAFMRLPLQKRRHILNEQAKSFAAHYKSLW